MLMETEVKQKVKELKIKKKQIQEEINKLNPPKIRVAKTKKDLTLFVVASTFEVQYKQDEVYTCHNLFYKKEDAQNFTSNIIFQECKKWFHDHDIEMGEWDATDFESMRDLYEYYCEVKDKEETLPKDQSFYCEISEIKVE